MRTIAVLLAALALAGCSSSPALPSGSATLTTFGPTTGLESWTTIVVEDVHVHAPSVDRVCALSAARELSAALGRRAADPPEQGEDLGRKLGSAMERSCSLLRGRAYGGHGRTALLLLRSDDALVVDLPQLPPGQTDRVYRAGEFSATFERPLTRPEAVLERGWVRAFRASGGRTEYELFLVLKPVLTGASYESIQVITRVENPGR
jgi:hypothetical protein